MNIQTPFYNNVIIKPIDIEKESNNRILLPNSEDKLNVGEVIATGPGLQNIMNGSYMPMQAKIGDIVAYPSFSGNKLILEDNNEYIVLKDTDILTSLK